MEKRLYIKLTLLLLMFGGSFTLIFHFYNESSYILTSAASIASAALALLILTFQLDVIKKMKYIIEAIDNKDYMFSFVTNRKRRDINSYLNTIREMLENARKEVEERERYYHTVLDNISSSVIITNQNSSILKLNKAAKTLLGLDNISHINNLSNYYPGMSEAFNSAAVNSSTSFSFTTEKDQFKISIQLTIWQNATQKLHIYTLSNISSELEYKELESWSRLSKVLTHEIMNSLTPIISISSSLVENKHIEDSDIATGLNVIHNTSNSLVKFVNNYRQLSRIATPEMAPVYVKGIIDNVVGLYDNIDSKIKFKIVISPENLMIYADENQIIQIVINLVKNAIESIINGEDSDNNCDSKNCQGVINIECYSKENEDVIIKISDSGGRISEDAAEHIFVPFFTTKSGGSGIGLSVSRQIMRLHNGSIVLIQNSKSKSFVLTFR